MAGKGRKRAVTSEPAGRVNVVGKRPKREGPYAPVHLSVTPANDRLLRGLATLYGTDPSELVQDWIEVAANGMRFSIPGGPDARDGWQVEALVKWLEQQLARLKGTPAVASVGEAA